MIEPELLLKLYIDDKASMMEIAKSLHCSVHKIAYWMDVHKIPRRTISEAIYQKSNPNGDPFLVKPITTKRDAELLGLGLGLYWGEGNKANKTSLRLGNTDPELIKSFMRFLIELFGVQQNKFKFTLQIFTDINPETALNYWVEQLQANRSQFGKITVTISGSIGTYRNKCEYGVLTVCCHNKKLRDIIMDMLPR